MKNISLISILSSFISCGSSTPSYIQGYIYSNGEPAENIRIQDPYNSIVFTNTNKKGYFKINQLTKGEFLYVMKGKAKIDSIYYIRTHPERGTRYYFVEGRSDTLFLKLK